MSKFNTQGATPTLSSVIESAAPTINHEGLPAFSRTVKSDLFLLGVTNFVREETFYEPATERDNRFRDLVHAVTKEDPTWVFEFVRYLRQTANMRSASLVAAVEYVRAGGHSGRSVVAAACQRADEPGEVLAYYTTQYGRSIPAAIKRGVADAARRLYNERSYLKYDSDKRAWRWADVLQVAHVKAATPGQNSLFGYVLDSYYKGKEAGLYAQALPVLGKNRDYHEMDKETARAQLLENPDNLWESGLTWEALSSFGPMDKAAWEAVIPSMGYMALLRNLRNFDEAGISDEVAARVITKLTDPEQVAKSRQLVFRFYSAFKTAPSLRWGQALETALDLATKNIPAFKGRTLVLIDTSWSMQGAISVKSSVSAAEVAALVGSALAKSGQDVDITLFATYSAPHVFPRGGSTLATTKSILARQGELGMSTNIGTALQSFNDHDRVIILSDMQTTDYVSRQGIPDRTPIYGFNLRGYSSTVVDSTRNDYELGGFTDNTFAMISALERGRDAKWPWNA